MCCSIIFPATDASLRSERGAGRVGRRVGRRKEGILSSRRAIQIKCYNSCSKTPQKHAVSRKNKKQRKVLILHGGFVSSPGSECFALRFRLVVMPSPGHFFLFSLRGWYDGFDRCDWFDRYDSLVVRIAIVAVIAMIAMIAMIATVGVPKSGFETFSSSPTNKQTGSTTRNGTGHEWLFGLCGAFLLTGLCFELSSILLYFLFCIYRFWCCVIRAFAFCAFVSF